MESRSEICIVSRSTTLQTLRIQPTDIQSVFLVQPIPLGYFFFIYFHIYGNLYSKKLQAEHTRFLGSLLGLNRMDEQRNAVMRTKLQAKIVYENIAQY
jgi:hypothetical protein